MEGELALARRSTLQFESMYRAALKETADWRSQLDQVLPGILLDTTFKNIHRKESLHTKDLFHFYATRRDASLGVVRGAKNLL